MFLTEVVRNILFLLKNAPIYIQFFSYEVKQITKIRNFKVRHHASKYSGFEIQSQKVQKQGFMRPDNFFNLRISSTFLAAYERITYGERNNVFTLELREHVFSFLFISEDVSYYFVLAVSLNNRRLNLAQNELVTLSTCVTNDLLCINITIRLFGGN